MAEFTTIETEEAFLAAVKERYGDVEDIKTQLATATGERDAHAATIDTLNEKIRGMEANALRHKVAHDKGLPYELAARIAGDTEDAMMADAESLMRLFQRQQGPAPAFEPKAGAAAASAEKAALANLAKSLKGAI